MTQQELLEKLNECLSPLGYTMKLRGNWQSGKVTVSKVKLWFPTSMFTHQILFKMVKQYIANNKEIYQNSDEPCIYTFITALKEALDGVAVEERKTTRIYTYDQELFSYLKDTLIKYRISVYTVYHELYSSCDNISFKTQLHDTDIVLFSTSKDRFDVDSVEKSIKWTREDLQDIQDGDKVGFVESLNTIENHVLMYKRKLIASEVEGVLNGTITF